MHNDNTTVVLVCRCSQMFSLSLPVWFFSSRPRTPEGRARYSFLLRRALLFFCVFAHRPAWFWGVIFFTLCAFTTCPCAFVCCNAPIVAAEKWEGLCVCVCVCVCVLGCMAAWHVPHLTSPSLSLSLSLSLCVCVCSPSFHPGFCVLHNCVLFSVPQLTCSDTLHCSCSTSAASGKGRRREGEGQMKTRVAGGCVRKSLELGETA